MVERERNEKEREDAEASCYGGGDDVDAVVTDGPWIQIRTRYATGPSIVIVGLGEEMKL